MEFGNTLSNSNLPKNAIINFDDKDFANLPIINTNNNNSYNISNPLITSHYNNIDNLNNNIVNPNNFNFSSGN